MSDLRVSNLKGRTPGSSPILPDGIRVTGVGTFSSDVEVAGNLNVTGDLVYDEATAVNLKISGIATVGSAITMYGSTGIVSATQFYGDGANLTGVISGVELSADGSSVGSAITAINLAGFESVTTPTAGLSTVTTAGWSQEDTWLFSP